MSDNAEENQEPIPENITQDPQPEPQPIEADVPRETIGFFLIRLLKDLIRITTNF